jgi:protein-S-isoprenylcysteine O-methyltransferase Ste14
MSNALSRQFPEYFEVQHPNMEVMGTATAAALGFGTSIATGFLWGLITRDATWGAMLSGASLLGAGWYMTPRSPRYATSLVTWGAVHLLAGLGFGIIGISASVRQAYSGNAQA